MNERDEVLDAKSPGRRDLTQSFLDIFDVQTKPTTCRRIFDIRLFARRTGTQTKGERGV
ncbi:MAG: hypothetical protein Tsb009_12800 [Planctomycetaceae bacterium]